MFGGTEDAILPEPKNFPRIAGVACLMITREDTAALEVLRDRGVPVVGINAYPGRRAISRVAADQAGGAADAVRMLVAKGHRRIAFLPGPPGNLGADERLQGYRTQILPLARTEVRAPLGVRRCGRLSDGAR